LVVTLHKFIHSHEKNLGYRGLTKFRNS